MMKKAHARHLAPVLLLLAGCHDERALTGPQHDPVSFAISDGAEARGGNPHFYFLPPMVPSPEYDGTFDASLAPRVEICQATACTSVIAWSTLAGGEGLDALRAVAEDEHYAVNWHTKSFDLDAGKTYRIRVSVAGTQLGYADVDVVEKGSELKQVPAGFVPLLKGQTLLVSPELRDLCERRSVLLGRRVRRYSNSRGRVAHVHQLCAGRRREQPLRVFLLWHCRRPAQHGVLLG